MRSIFISFAISILLSGLFVYLLDNISPISEEGYERIEQEFQINTQSSLVEFIPEVRRAGILFEILNIGNLSAMLIVSFLTLISSFMTIHLFVDKMFFKEFYKNPDIGIGFRRSVIFGLWGIGAILIRLMGYWNIPVLILISVILLLVEMLFWRQVNNIQSDVEITN